MDHYKRELRLAEDIKKASARLNHLSAVMDEVKKKLKECENEIRTFDQKLKELHNEHG